MFPIDQDWYVYDIFMELYNLTEEGRIPREIGAGNMENWKAIGDGQLRINFNKDYLDKVIGVVK